MSALVDLDALKAGDEVRVRAIVVAMHADLGYLTVRPVCWRETDPGVLVTVYELAPDHLTAPARKQTDPATSD